MSEAEEPMNQGNKLIMFRRLSRHLLIPGRLDEAIYILKVEANNMFSPNAASSTLARAICDQLELRIPPELLRLARLLEEWEESHPQPNSPAFQPSTASPRLSRAEKIAILGPQIVIGLIIAYTSIAAIGISAGRSPTEVILLWVVLTSLTLISVLCCIKFTEAPRSIPEAQFIFQAHQGRMEYAAKGLLDHPIGGHAA